MNVRPLREQVQFPQIGGLLIFISEIIKFFLGNNFFKRLENVISFPNQFK